MKIKTRLIITALAMMLSMAAFGQSPIKVKEFRMLPNGIMDAGVLEKDQQTDYDGNKVCLIKVRAFGIGEETMQRLTFKTNGPFITHKEYENGEYRLYVSSNREGSIVIRYNGDCEYILPSRLKEGKIYEMVLEMETGTLTVVATPVEAKIYVDDAYAGTGSVNVQLSVGAEHRCRVECQDYIKVEKTVSFAKNEEKTLTVELVPNFGYITVKSEPSGAELYIDDKKAGTTPYLARRISRGQHRVEVRKRGYEPYADVVTININETTRIEDVKLEASNEVTSIPQQQEYVGGFSNQTITVNGVNFEMVYVEGGSFDMGATTEQGSDAYKDEYPAHSVTLSDYYIGRCEVTQELWEAVMGSNPSYFKGAQNPVECVSWNDCQEFVSRLSSLTGRTFRLPTEAEWEYAARGGNKSGHYKYSGIGNIDDVAWYWKNSGDRYLQGTDSDYDRDKIINNNGRTHAVGTKTANELGIYDMSGNVYEWCSDWYGDYSAGTQTNPQGPSSGSDRVLRGGSWYGRAWCCRVSFRIYNDPNDSSDLDGLRLVLVP